MGNSNGNIDAYWMAIDNTLGLQGGFIWDWADQVMSYLLSSHPLPFLMQYSMPCQKMVCIFIDDFCMSKAFICDSLGGSG